MVSSMPRVSLGDVAREVKQRAPEGAACPSVGLEHLDPDEIELSRWNEDGENTFTKSFSRGQVLFGRRRAYLRKAAVAPFDGVCSGDITVIEARETLSPRLLPFIIQNEALFKHAVSNSAGSLSPRVKWQSLAQFEFNLPARDQQEKLADLLWAAQDTRNHYKQLLSICDDVIKSQFVEMFSDGGFPRRSLSSLSTSMQNGLSPSKAGIHRAKVLTLSAITQGSFDESAWKEGAFKDDPSLDKRVSGGCYYVCRGNGNRSLVGTGEFAPSSIPDLVFPDTMIEVRVKQGEVLPAYLTIAWKQPFTRDQIERSAKTTNGTYKINQKALGEVEIPVPPLSLQQEFASFVAQVDKSKFAIQKALDELNATTKKILNQELGL